MAARPGLIRPETNIFDSSALRIVFLCITPIVTPAYPLHLFHTKDEEDSGKGLFESTTEVAPFDEGDRIGVVKIQSTPTLRSSACQPIFPPEQGLLARWLHEASFD